MVNNIDKKELLYMILIIVISIFLISLYIYNSNQLKNESNSDSLKKSLTFQEAILDGDISNCDFLSESNLIESCKLELIECNTDDCYFDKARYKMDEQLCFKIKDENKVAGCTAAIKISDIKQRAVLEDNIEICNEFGNQDGINLCRDNFYIANRYNKDDLSFCNNILNEVVKNECLK